jgi:CDP-glycerol glycerophosphotransferase (TagB/SpsB family)
MMFKLLYIDPGTGSMLFSIIIGIAGVLIFVGHALIIKLKFLLLGGRAANSNSKRIPICIFSEGKRYWNVFKPVLDEFEKRGKDVRFFTAGSDDPALSAGYRHVNAEFIGEGNKAISKMNLINADLILSTTPSLDVFQWKRSKSASYYVHIPHMPNDITTYKMFGLDFYDAVLVSGKYQEEQIRRLEKIRSIPAKEIVLTGIPYLDKMKERLDGLSKSDGSNKEKTILLAPSWGNNGILTAYGASFIESLIKTSYKIIIRPHPQSFTSEKELIDRLMARFPESDKLKWNRDPDNFNVLNEADILISDFSGVLFDFSLVFNKPVIYTEPSNDWSQYDCAWDTEELWTYQILPKIGRKLTQENFGNIGSLIEDCISGSDASELAKGRDLAREQTWCNMGHGAEKVVDYLISKHNELSEKAAKASDDAKKTANRRKSRNSLFA